MFGCPVQIASFMLEHFTELHAAEDGSEMRAKTKFLTDKLMLHMLAVAITAEDFTMSPDLIAADLKISPQRYSTRNDQL